MLVKGFFFQKKDRVHELEEKLRQHLDRIKCAFLMEIREDVLTIKQDVREVKEKTALAEAQKCREEEDRLLKQLLPPEESLFGGKPACLQGMQ